MADISINVVLPMVVGLIFLTLPKWWELWIAKRDRAIEKRDLDVERAEIERRAAELTRQAPVVDRAEIERRAAELARQAGLRNRSSGEANTPIDAPGMRPSGGADTVPVKRQQGNRNTKASAVDRHADARLYMQIAVSVVLLGA